MKQSPDFITELGPNQIFVFGSNEQGLHYGGAAKQALQWGAEIGNPEGIQGQTYAIPTKKDFNNTLPLLAITVYVNEFLHYCMTQSYKEFLVTEIGCGLAGLTVEQIAPMFTAVQHHPILKENVYLPKRFIEHITMKTTT